MSLKPAKKKVQQSSLTKFFGTSGNNKSNEEEVEVKPISKSPKIAAMKPKPKAAPSKKPVAKAKKYIDSDDDAGDGSEVDVEPPVPKRSGAPKRAARAAPKKYIEIGSDDDEDETFDVSD